MKTLLLSFSFLLFANLLIAQQRLSGRITQPDGQPVEFATITLHAAADSALVKGSISDATGRFELENIAAGRYFLRASLVGTGQAVHPPFDYDGADRALEPLILTENELSTVTVTARRPLIEVQADKTILNVEGNINSQGQNALELLRKAPGVMLDQNDNIQLKGKNQVRFQIDGRDVPMSSKDLAQLLKGMRAEDIAAFEMITNPSAKYDASGNAGIINIKTRKNRADGTNGSVGGEAIYGESLKGSGRFSFNHRNKALNVFGNYNNHFGDWHNELNLYREQAGRTIYDQKGTEVDNNNNHNFKLGTDFFLNSRHTVGFLVDGRHARGPWENESHTYISSLATPGRIDSVLVATNRVPQERNNFNFNVNYRFADTAGHEFNFDANRGIYRFRADSYQPNYYLDPTEQNVLSQNIYRNNTPTDIDITIIKGDYEQKLFKGKFAVGFKLNRVETDNTFDFYNVLNDVPILNPERSNRFVYDEMVSAGYVNYNFQHKKWGFQAGLRAEHTDWTGTLVSTVPGMGEVNDDRYLSWFPSAAVNYKLNDKNQFNLTYSRRIDRPNYRNLNPFEDRLNELAYRKGNPFLRPQFTNSVEMSYTFMGAATATLGYSRTNDMFTEVIDTASGDRTYLTNENIARQDNYSLALSIPMPIAKWWEGFVSITGFIADFDADFRPGFSYSERFKAMNVYSEQTFRVPKGWSFQLSGWYNSPAIWGAVFRSKAQGAMDFGVRKQLFDGDATVSLTFGDILRTAGWASVNDFTPGLYMLASGTWESRTVRLNADYRFGNKKIKGSRQRQTGTEDVNRRIGG